MNPPPLQAEHRCRVSVLEPERLWSLRGEVLAMGDERGEIRIPLVTLRKIRLEFAPTRFQLGRFRCHLYDQTGPCGTIQNEHFAGLATFEDRSASYRALVLMLLQRTAAVNPSCRFEKGAAMWSWLLQTAFMLGMGLLLAVVLFFLWTAIGWLVVLKLLILAFFVPTAIRWVVRNKPADFRVEAIPMELLPEVKPA